MADDRQISRQTGQSPLLFDERPIELEGFRLHARGATAVGRPTIAQWTHALDVAAASHDSSGFWIGALWNYGEGRRDWHDKLDQALADAGRSLTRKTLVNLGYMDRKVATRAKQLAPSASHAAVVADLDPAEQVEVMEQARTEELTVRETRLAVKARKRRRIIEGQAKLEGQYRVLYADPPWLYGDRPPSGSGAKDHYPPMTINALCQLPIPAHTTPNAVLFLWTTAPIILQTPGPREVIDAWGFKYKTQMIWDKVLHGFGHYVEVRHEILCICTRGSCLPDRPTPMVPSVLTERRSDVHSEKPHSVRRLIERLYDGPYLELFGRERYEGWTVFGNDARLWAMETPA